MDDFITYPHWRDVPEHEWPWPNFRPYEFCSPDTKAIKIYRPLVDKLQQIRSELGKPMNVTSGYRTPENNTAVGGVANSQHVLGRAADIALPEAGDGPTMEAMARRAGIRGIGRYPPGHGRFIHLDLREGRKAVWGAW